ncbi:glycosyltransferase family 4 protein [Asticcacaulis excentricus]|uniref:Glycosyl transferase group 1 n=1 Tax=Asticcacaulis excentricus (strain ATCC 15261 / DSM 4724 / KCTC 12464 / NCIMB 9791 / VKM B-1370 / CB 48) TaxID=573065 RepID=E8RMC0_ASTEC|nr:glycosyltransferase family 1 protein [Asticcacaulis excentricus]ADU13871.1 glycosyl transferase group 1 [Asticcacaulis excentricus CB 48]
MRGLVINGKFLSQKTTGVQRVAHALTSELLSRDLGIKIRVAAPKAAQNPWATGAGASVLKGVPWEQLELPVIAGKDLLVSLCNVAPVARNGDVVMIHDAQAFISPKSYSSAFRTYYQTLLPIIGARASRVLTVSNYSADCLTQNGIAPREKIDVIHNGVDHILTIARNDEVLERLNLKGRPFLAALGSVQHHKNIKTLVAAAARFANKEARLVLIGAATRADYEAAGIEVGESVCLAGRLSDEDMRSVVEHAQAFLFPSLTEGFGLPPLEAMLLGTPAIVAPCGAMPELCIGDALFCEAENVGEWADTINNLLADSALRAQYSKLGIERAKKYTWASAGDKLAEVLLRSL